MRDDMQSSQQGGVLPVLPAGEAFEAVLRSCPDGVLLLDLAGRPVWCNQAFLDLWQLASCDQLRQDAGPRGGLWQESGLADASGASEASIGTELPHELSMHHLRDGRWVERRCFDQRIADRKVGLVVLWRDVSQVQQSRQEAEHQREMMDTLINSLPDPIYFKDEQLRFIRVNPSMARRLGLSNPAQAVGRRDADFLAPAQAERTALEEREIMRTGQPVDNRLQQEINADGRAAWSLVTRMPLRDAQGRIVGTFGIVRDITEQKRSESVIWEQANFDALTGLPNRRMLRDRWEQASRHAQRNGLGMALMMLDLDHFKDVNDTLGHARGDELLIEVARRIKAVVRDSDVVARLGGDEFCLILTDLSETAHVGDIAQKIVAELALPFHLGPDEVFISASLGISIGPRNGWQIDKLMQQADQALYVAKGNGRNGFRFFTSELQAQAQERLVLGKELRQALARSEFFLVYQPMVELDSGLIGKVEALLRWRHPTRGVIGPREFIAVAESSGLAGEIAEWVFAAAARQLHDWRERIAPQLQMAINKSPLQACKPRAKLEDWRALLHKLDLPADVLMIEITESQLLEPSERVDQHLQALRELGLRVSLDDFGTGISSLSRLQSLQIDTVKIDQSFVGALTRDSSNLALCKAIISMAHELGMQVVAEGVETAEQSDLLLEAGCDQAQGYFFGKPMAVDQMEAWLREPCRTMQA